MFKVNVLILFVTALFCALTISQVEGTVKYVHPSRRNANANSNTNTNSNTNSNRNKNRRNANDGISNDTLLSPESSCVEEKTVAAAMAAAEATKTIATALLQDLSETTGDAVAVAVLRILSDKKRRPSRRSIKAAARGAVITAATRRNSNINSNTNINTNFNSIGKKQPQLQPQQLQQQQLRKPKRMGRPTATGYIYQRPNEALILGPISYGKLKGYVNKLDLGSLNAESDYFGMPMEGTGGFDHQGDIYYDSLEDEDDDEDEDEDADDNDKNDDSSNKEKDEAVDASPEDKHPTRVKNKNININTNFNSRRGVYTPGRLY